MSAAETQWTHEELDQWFLEEMGGVESMERRFDRRDDDDWARPVLGNAPDGNADLGNDDLEQFITAWNGLWQENPIGIHPTTPEQGWADLALETKAALRRGWERYLNAREDRDGVMGHDSIVDELSGDMLRDPAPPPTRRGPSWLAIALGGLAALVVLIALLALMSGGDDDGGSDVAAEDEQPAINLLVNGGTATYAGPVEFAAGEAVEIEIVIVDENGLPLAGQPWFVTLGDPPSAPDAVHDETTTDDDGRAAFELDVPDQPGRTKLWTSDGTDAWEVTPIDIVDAPVSN